VYTLYKENAAGVGVFQRRCVDATGRTPDPQLQHIP